MEIWAVIAGAILTGGVAVKVLDRFFSKSDLNEANRAELRKIQADENVAIREWWEGQLKELQASLRVATESEGSWRIKYWELLGTHQATEAELVALRPKFVAAIQDAQALLAEVETYRAREQRGRRATDEEQPPSSMKDTRG